MSNFQLFASQLIDSSSRCIFFTDVPGRLTMVNDAASSYFAKPKKDLIGQLACEVISDGSLKTAIESACDAFRQGEKSFSRMAQWNKDGEPSTLQFRGDQVVSSDGVVQGYTYVFSSERTSEVLRHNETILNNLMRHCPDMIYFKDVDSRFTHVSDSMSERLGASCTDELIGKSDFDFWDKVSATQFYNDEQGIVRTREPLISKAQKEIRADGKTTWVLSSKMPLLDEHNQVVGTFGISKDITEHKEIECELEYANKKLIDASRRAGMAQIATNVIHNVGNVLNSINVSLSQTTAIVERLKLESLSKVAELMKDDCPDRNCLTNDEKRKRIPEYLTLLADELKANRDDIKKELEATKRHLNHIKMIVSRQQELATATSVVEEVDVADVLDEAVRMSSSSFERHKISLTRNYDRGTKATIDKHRVLQILVNLIRNAKHAMQEAKFTNRRLTISVTQVVPGQISIAVADNGVGISPENLPKLFHHGFTTKHNGRGFGLHSAANTAKELGGSLTADSQGPNRGATFTLTLPVAVDGTTAAALPIVHTADSPQLSPVWSRAD